MWAMSFSSMQKIVKKDTFKYSTTGAVSTNKIGATSLLLATCHNPQF